MFYLVSKENLRRDEHVYFVRSWLSSTETIFFLLVQPLNRERLVHTTILRTSPVHVVGVSFHSMETTVWNILNEFKFSKFNYLD